MSLTIFIDKKGGEATMADDNKKNPVDQTPTEDQQKGGEATATDQDVSDVTGTDYPTGEDTELPELDEDDSTKSGNE
jgi:hypothetical protein